MAYLSSLSSFWSEPFLIVCQLYTPTGPLLFFVLLFSPSSRASADDVTLSCNARSSIFSSFTLFCKNSRNSRRLFILVLSNKRIRSLVFPVVEFLDVNGSKPSLRFFVSWSSLTASSISKSRFPRGGKGVFSVLVVRFLCTRVMYDS